MEQKNLILGFDFGEKYSQFCCYDRGTHTAVSIPVKEGEEAVEFPTAIAKKRNEETWKTGPDAEKSAHAENGIWLDNLYEICMGVGDHRPAHGDGQVGKGHLAGEDTQDGHDDVGGEGVGDGLECAADDHADGHVHHIAPSDEGLELVDKLFHSRDRLRSKHCFSHGKNREALRPHDPPPETVGAQGFPGLTALEPFSEAKMT